MTKYIVIFFVSKEPYLLYYCGIHDKRPVVHEAPSLVKQMPLEEAQKVFDSFDSSHPVNKGVTVCLIEWVKFALAYQIDGTKEAIIKSSLKTK